MGPVSYTAYLFTLTHTPTERKMHLVGVMATR